MRMLRESRAAWRWLRHADGFSLLESVLACGVLAVGVLSVVHLFALATTMTATSHQATSAAILAVQKLEALRADPRPVPGRDLLDRFGVAVDERDAGRVPAYRRRWTVSDAGGDLVAIAVAVTAYRAGAPVADDSPAGAVRLMTLRPRGTP